MLECAQEPRCPCLRASSSSRLTGLPRPATGSSHLRLKILLPLSPSSSLPSSRSPVSSSQTTQAWAVVPFANPGPESRTHSSSSFLQLQVASHFIPALHVLHKNWNENATIKYNTKKERHITSNWYIFPVVSLGATVPKTRKRRFQKFSHMFCSSCISVLILQHFLLLTIYPNSAVEQSTSGERRQGAKVESINYR